MNNKTTSSEYFVDFNCSPEEIQSMFDKIREETANGFHNHGDVDMAKPNKSTTEEPDKKEEYLDEWYETFYRNPNDDEPDLMVELS